MLGETSWEIEAQEFEEFGIVAIQILFGLLLQARKFNPYHAFQASLQSWSPHKLIPILYFDEKLWLSRTWRSQPSTSHGIFLTIFGRHHSKHRPAILNFLKQHRFGPLKVSQFCLWVTLTPSLFLFFPIIQVVVHVSYELGIVKNEGLIISKLNINDLVVPISLPTARCLSHFLIYFIPL